jgi:siderophore synthetase component
MVIELEKTLEYIYQIVLSGGYDPHEAEMLYFLEKQKPAYAPAYQKNLSKARATVLKAVVSSMLRENIMDLSNQPFLTVEEAKEELGSLGESENDYIGYHRLVLNYEEEIWIPVQRIYAFQRYFIDQPFYVKKNERRTLSHPIEWIYLLKSNSSYRWEELAQELCNACANQALAYAFWEHKKRSISKEMSKEGITNVIEWVSRQKQHQHSFNSSMFFEQLCIEGHNLHPGAKTKMGMEPSAVFAYAPECQGTPDLHFVAVHKEMTEWSVYRECRSDFWDQYPGLQEAALEQGIDLELYQIIPVHVWQWERIIPQLYAKEIAQNLIIPIHNYSIASQSMSSFRTVQPVALDSLKRWSVKVSVDSQMTSTVRSISRYTTNNGPRLTECILKIVEQELLLKEKIIPLGEWLGFNFKSEDERKSRNLSAVFRESVESQIGDDELAIVGTALYAPSPMTGQALICDIIEQYLWHADQLEINQVIKQFVTEYATLVLSGYLTLMVKYGVGLEGHLQNSIPVFRQGKPIRLLIRDWGGARIFKKRLEKYGLPIDILPGSLTLAKKENEMRNKVFYTVYQNHLGELIIQICKYYAISESELWQIVFSVTDQIFSQLMRDDQIREDAEADRSYFYQSDVLHKALAYMRLAPQKGDIYVAVPNPLYPYACQKRSLFVRG